MRHFPRLLAHPLTSGKSFFLFGPRGTGKTTWLRKNVPDALYINLLQSEFYNPLVAEPSQLRRLIPAEDFSRWVVIDEVQRIPQVLHEVHHLIESRGLRFILTGSSARTLRRRGVNLLAGRARTYQMHPLTAPELGRAFDLEDALRFGHLPARFSDPDPAQYLKDYVQTYLREEVLQEGLTRNIGHFSRFLETASLSQGQVLNISTVAREAQVARGVAERYFSILEDLLLAVRLPVFARSAKRQLIAQSKFYFFDVGVFRTLRPQGPLDSAGNIDGPALETLVLQELLATNHYSRFEYAPHFWRTRGGLEIDFVLYGPHGLVAIEVKRARQLHSKDTRALREFQKDYPGSKALIFYGGDSPLYFDGIQALPLDQALRNLGELL
ncbi:MAG: ATP-binding protein [Gammaproteobacteria bacterium]|nr:ATP-binding protein [Gammaproteobacteria bacterium]